MAQHTWIMAYCWICLGHSVVYVYSSGLDGSIASGGTRIGNFKLWHFRPCSGLGSLEHAHAVQRHLHDLYVLVIAQFHVVLWLTFITRASIMESLPVP